MFNHSATYGIGANQTVKALSAAPSTTEQELVLVNWGIQPVSGDPVVSLHGWDGVSAFPVFYAGKEPAGDNLDGNLDPQDYDAFMGGIRLGPGLDLAVTVTGGSAMVTVWGYIIHGKGTQTWNDKGGIPCA